MLTVVTWLWTPPPNIKHRTTYGPEHVNSLCRMVRSFYPHPHRFVCLTDDPRGIECETLPVWTDHAGLPPPGGSIHNPQCYRRLRLFSPEARELLGTRIVSLDLDAVICGDLSPLWNRPEPFVIRASSHGYMNQRYNGSMFMLTAGAEPQVWADFDPVMTPRKAVRARLVGSDQAAIQLLAPNAATWTVADGVVSWYLECWRHNGRLPAGARIVFFEGRRKPWMREAQKVSPWIKEFLI